jgi:hypothetical protein
MVQLFIIVSNRHLTSELVPYTFLSADSMNVAMVLARGLHRTVGYCVALVVPE